MATTINNLEEQRLALQVELDAKKSPSARNRLGQFATPTRLATDILRHAESLMPDVGQVNFLDPAIGTGAFYSAFNEVFPRERHSEAIGFEIDDHYGEPASRLWAESGLAIQHADFTREQPSPRFNLLICNPPYVRHHHLSNDDKNRLQANIHRASGMRISGLAGLYCYFLGISHAWMADGGIAGWLIPSEFMDVNYGRAVKQYLLEKVTLLQIHRFDPSDVQFADALVSSAIVWFRKSPPPKDHTVALSFGGTLSDPKILRLLPSKVLFEERKWTRFPQGDIRAEVDVPVLSDFFRIKRGIATGHNSYFILNAETIALLRLPREVFRPILPSPRYLPDTEILANAEGLPLIERQLFLLDTRLSEEEIKERYPTLHAYLENGRSREIHARYLCRHRAPWYAQEDRPAAPVLCTYLGRGDAKTGRPFRFILNNSDATVANVYLAMYPTPILTRVMRDDPSLIRKIWRVLNEISPDRLLGEGRVYGGGLHKLEPRELAKVEATAIAELIPNFQTRSTDRQLSLFDNGKS